MQSFKIWLIKLNFMNVLSFNWYKYIFKIGLNNVRWIQHGKIITMKEENKCIEWNDSISRAQVSP